MLNVERSFFSTTPLPLNLEPVIFARREISNVKSEKAILPFVVSILEQGAESNAEHCDWFGLIRLGGIEDHLDTGC
jgi:hypothetical protein